MCEPWTVPDDGCQASTENSRPPSDSLDHGTKRQRGCVDEKPDLWVACHWRLSIDTQVVSYNPGWGYTWGYWAGPEMTQVYQVPSGSLFIDLVDVDKKVILWRGTASAEIRSNKENEEREERLRAILAKMFAGYPPPKA